MDTNETKVIREKREEYSAQQQAMLAKMREHEESASRARADAIACGGAIQACDQILAEMEKRASTPPA